MAHPLVTVINFGYNTLKKQLEVTKRDRETVIPILTAYEGDFWQQGSGSLLPPAAGDQASVIQNAMERHFIFRNVIKEVVECVSHAFFGKSPSWSLAFNGQPITDDTKPKPTTDPVPSEAPSLGKDQLDTIEKALSDFWTTQNVGAAMEEAFQTRLVGGRGGLRIYIPVKFTVPDSPDGDPNVSGDVADPAPDALPTEQPRQIVSFPDLVSGVGAMRIEFVPPRQAKLLTDNGDLMSVVEYQVVTDWATMQTEHVIEFSFVDNDGATFIGLVEERGEAKSLDTADLSDPLSLDGWPTYNEFQGTPYVTNALYKNNQLLNLALTCSSFSLVDNGFGEVFFTNVELEMERFTQPDGSPGERPKRMIRGGGAYQNLVGISQVNPDTGQEELKEPGVHIKDPSPMTAFKDGKELAYTACLEEAGQVYRLTVGDATASGESRIQAMADFVIKIMKYKSEVDKIGSWVLTTVLKWAAQICGQASELQPYTVIFDSKVFVSQVSADEKNTIISQRDKGIISTETARVLLGVEDPTIEEELVAAEQERSILEVPTAEAEARVAVALQLEGILPASTILKFLGFTDAEVIKMKQEIADDQATQLAQFTDPNNSGNQPPQPQPLNTGAGGPVA